LKGAILKGARLLGADLLGAHLDRDALAGTDVRGALLPDGTIADRGGDLP
jgi:uncharacterized protein YjbI with pentapeptide repeats